MVNVRRCLVFYLISWPMQNTSSKVLHWPKIDYINSVELAEIALYIARKHLRNLTSTLVVVEKSVTREKTNENVNILERFLQNLQDTTAVQLQINSKNKQPWDYYIFIVDSIDAFRIIYSIFPNTFHERRFHFIIILTKYTFNFANVIEQIFVLCYQLNVIDVIIIVKHPTDGVCMFTYILYSKNACRTVQPILYLRLNGDLKNLKTIFPEKLNNFYGCPVNVTGRKLGPFLDLVGNKSNPQPVGSWENLSGVEGLLIRELALALNFKLQLLPFPEGRSYIENFTCYGSFLELKNGNADIAIGGFSDSDPSRWLFSQSYVYHSSPFVYIVRGRELSPMARLAKPFTNQVWIVLVVFLIISFLFIISVRFLKITTRQYIFGGDDNEAPSLNFIAIILGYPVNRTPPANRNFARYVLLLLLLLTLVVRNAYQGSLYDAIRRDEFVRIPSGYEEIVKWNYKILISPEFENFNAYTENLTITIPYGGYLQRLKILETIQGRYASAVLRESFIDYMKKNNWKRNDLFMTHEVIILYHFVMFFPKNSIYLATFNKKLQGLTYSGITNKLKFNLTTKAALRSITRMQPLKVALDNKRFRALYDIYIFMKIVAVLVFCLELISVRYKGLYRVFQWIG